MSDAKTKPSNPDGITGRLSSWIADTQYSSIPPEVVERAKYLVLDGIACGLVAAHLPWSETAANAIFKMEPPGQCSVIGWGDKKLSPLAATLLNSTFIQGFELDDYHSRAPLHSNALLLPSLFAAVESAAEETASSGSSNTKFSGKEFLHAYVIGCEIGPRVGLALHGGDLLSRGWHSGAVQGPSAVCAAVSSLLRLSPAHVESALGIACTQAGGLMSAQFGSDAKRMQHGFAARNGLFAALIARSGYTGIEEVYETPANLEPKTLPDELINGLGERWELHGVRVKLHAAMAALHGTIDCVEKLQEAHPDQFKNDELDKIDRIVTQHSKAAYEHGGWIAPADKPLSSLGAQMSIQYAAAAQLLDREVLMAQFGAEKLNRPRVRELMAKVQPEYSSALDVKGATSFRTIVTVHFRDTDETLKQSVEGPKGITPPASNEDVVQKWRSLVSGVIDDKRRDEIEAKVLGLESLEDARELIRLLQADVRCPIDV